MVDEGVASAADIDKAVKYGFGFRFAVLGLLEFIDWGGGDILHYASQYLSKALDHPRYEAPEVIARNMAQGRIGMTPAKASSITPAWTWRPTAKAVSAPSPICSAAWPRSATRGG